MADLSTASIRELLEEEFQTQEDRINPLLVDVGAELVESIRAGGAGAVEAAIENLDELVHGSMEEAPGDPDDNSQKASGINNRGLEAQVACILAGWGSEEGAEKIREAAGLPQPAAGLKG